MLVSSRNNEGSPAGDGWEFEKYGRYLYYSGGDELPKVIFYNNRKYFRFMDRIYCPAPVYELSPSAVVELCRLRLHLRHEIIDEAVYESVVRKMLSVGLNLQHRQRCRHILDFGCGDGRSLDYINEIFPDSQLFGADIAEYSTSSASKNYVRIVNVDPFGALPFETDFFDVIFAFFVFHFSIPKSGIFELRRVISSRGIIVGNCYGDYIDQYRGLFQDCGFRLFDTTTISGIAGHVIDVWISK